MTLKPLLFAAAIVLAAPVAAQSPRDPFAAMTPAGREKALALNARIEAEFDARVEQMTAIRTRLVEALKAQPQDIKAIRETAQQYEDGLLATRGDWTVAWVDLAAALEPSDRNVILARLPRGGGIFRPPPAPPLPPAAWSANPFYKATPKVPAPSAR